MIITTPLLINQYETLDKLSECLYREKPLRISDIQKSRKDRLTSNRDQISVFTTEGQKNPVAV